MNIPVRIAWMLALSITIAVLPAYALARDAERGAVSRIWEGVKQEVGAIWRDGDIELYVPVYDWHLPFAYTDDQREEYVDYPAGFGIGKGRTDEKGNWRGFYMMVFRDSHGDPEPIAGYAWIARWGSAEGARAGVGLTAFITARQDYDWAPVPGILPVGSLEYKRFALQGAYVPGDRNWGNVILFWCKYTF